MITENDFLGIPLFASVDRERAAGYARKAADVRVGEGEYIVQEGEPPAFFALLEGKIELTKRVEGSVHHMATRHPGDYVGEIPVMLGSPFFVSARSLTAARLLRLEAIDFAKITRENEAVRQLVFQTILERIEGVAEETVESEPELTIVIGSNQDLECFNIREFLTRNQLPFEWIDPEEPGAQARIPAEAQNESRRPLVLVCESGPHEYRVLAQPSLREVAEAMQLQTRPQQAQYDVAIVGAGPAGLAAAVYGASEGLSTILFESAVPGGQAGSSSRIENYLGFPTGLSGDELAKRALEQAQRFGAEVVVTRNVEAMAPHPSGHRLELEDGENVLARSVVIATGVSYRKLDVDGCDQYSGAGVYYGAARTEAISMRGEDVYLIGGGNSAGQAAMFFANYANLVTLLVRSDDLAASMSHYLIEQLGTRKNVRVRTGAEMVGASGGTSLETITIRDRKTGRVETVNARAVFIFIGAEARTGWLPAEIARDANGFVLTGKDIPSERWGHDREPALLETSVAGVFCAGDVRHGSIKRVAAGVGEGSMSIAFIHQYLSGLSS